MEKYPKIGHFKDALKVTKKKGYSRLKYRGTVKLHGTHCDIVCNKDGEIKYQSRNNIVYDEKEVCGLVRFLQDIDWNPLFEIVKDRTGHEGKIVISGEFCGRNIQKGVALEKLPKFVVLYGVWLVGEDNDQKYIDENCNRTWLDFADFKDLKVPEQRVFNILDYQTWEITIETTNPEPSRDLMEKLVEEVEKMCPVAKSLGVDGIGEGIVWNCLSDLDPHLTFKTKGAEHKVVNTKRLVEIDPEVVKLANEFVDRTVTENRLNQGLEYLLEQGLDHSNKNTGIFVKWVLDDVFNEEGDVCDPKCYKDTKKLIQKTASQWYLTLLITH